MSETDQRLPKLEAVQAIMRLKAYYAECADNKYTDTHEKKPPRERDEVAWRQALCFTEDGEFNAGEFGIVRGRQALFENFRTKPFVFSAHLYVNPIIDVADSCETATGRWLMWMLASDETRRPFHVCGPTFDWYRKVDGEWLFERVDVKLKFNVPFFEPWSRPARAVAHPATEEG
jgi:hypothetical protein